MKSKIYVQVILFTVLSFALSSCGVWYNFKAYFNSYYNAKVLFDQVEENIQKLPRDLFSFFEPTIQSTDYNALVKVNEKCSKILQFDTRSGYFIDALWLSGKSFYYQKDYIKAERKFKELLDAEQDSVKLLEVNLWLGKTELQLRNFDEGVKILDQVAESAIKAEEDDIFSEAVIKQIAFLMYKERFAEAIERGTKFIQNSSDSEKNAEVAYEIGKFYYKNGEYEKAANAFQSVLGFSPTFETEYNSKLEYAKCLIDLNRIDEGMELLDDMKNKTQYLKYFDEISVEIATGYYLKKEYTNALEIFTNIDTLYYGTKSSGVSEYMKGQIYEYHLPNFDSAHVYYSYANSNTLLSEEMKMQNNKKMNIFTRYITTRDDIRKLNKQIIYAGDKNEYLRDSVLYVDAVYRDTVDQRTRIAGRQGTINQFTNNPNQTGQNQFGNNQNTTVGQRTGEAETQTQIPPQAAMGAQSNTNNPNQTAQQNKLGLSSSQPNQSNIRRMAGQRTVVKNNIPPKPELPAISKDSLSTNLSAKLFNFAGIFFAEMDLPDSASYYYQKILQEFPAKPIIPNTYFALGTYYSTVNMKDKADSLFNIVYNNYKKSDVAISAAKKLGLIDEIPKSDAAESLYLEAEKKYYDKKYNEAINDFRNIISTYPKSKMAPKSAYYIAFIFENDIKDVDSTTAAYEFLSKKFPESSVAAKVITRNNIYQEEKKKKEPVKPEAALPAAAQTVPPQNMPAAKNDSSKVMSDSIRAMMLKAQLKDAVKEKEKRAADSIRAVRQKEK